MKTTIFLCLLAISTLEIYAQDLSTEDLMQKRTLLRNKPDSLVSGLEDLLVGVTSIERQRIESMKNWMLYIDDAREIRNMLELYKVENNYIDSNIANYSFFDIVASCIDEYIGNYDLAFDSCKIYLDQLTNRTRKDYHTERVMSQVWNHPEFVWYYEGVLPKTNFKKSYQYYIEEVNFPHGEIEIDTIYPWATNRRLKSSFRKLLINKIESIDSDWGKFQNYVALLENLDVSGLTDDLREIAETLSESVILSESTHEKNKMEILIGVNKILAGHYDKSLDELIMTNYGRLYGLIGEEHPEKKKYVQFMEIQMLNRLAYEHSRKNKFVMEGFRNLHNLLDSRENGYSEEEYFHLNLTLAELLVNQFKSHKDRDFQFSDQQRSEFHAITLWRILNIIYEFEKFEKRGGVIPIYLETRLFSVIMTYAEVFRDEDLAVRFLSKELRDQKVNSNLLYTAISSAIPMYLKKAGFEDEANLWREYFGMQVNSELDLLLNNAFENDQLQRSLNRMPSEFTKSDRKLWLSKGIDSIIDIHDSLILYWHQVPQGFKDILKKIAPVYFELESFFMEHGQYKRANTMGALARLARGSEFDLEIYSELIASRNDAYRETKNQILNTKNDRLKWETDHLDKMIKLFEQEVSVLNRSLELKKNQLAQKEKELKRKRILIHQKETELTQKDSLLSSRDMMISSANEELSRIEKEIFQKEQELKNTEKDLGTANVQKLRFESESRTRGFLIIFLCLFAALLINRWWVASKRKKLAKKNEETALENERIAKHERDIAEGLRKSIGQIGHLCEVGIANVSKNYLRFVQDENGDKARNTLRHLSTTFKQFRTNRGEIENTVENEVNFAIELLYSQHPKFCEGKTKDELLDMIDYESVKSECVPIYTVVNGVNNFFRHNILDERNELHIFKSDSDKNIRKITLRSFAEISPAESTGEGMKYTRFMIETVYGGTDVLEHYPNGEFEYVTIMNLKQTA